MKPEISYELKIIGAKKLLARTCCGVRTEEGGQGWGFVAACDYNFSLKCAAKEYRVFESFEDNAA